MGKSEELFNRLREKRLIALLTPERVEDCLAAFTALDPLGVTLEVTLRGDEAVALAGIAAVVARKSSALVLAGTVMTRVQADRAIDAGAAGIVSADYIPAVVETCVRRGVMCIPGGWHDAGKQLVQKAELCGCTFGEMPARQPWQWVYKFFPAVAGGHLHAGMARSLRGPFPGLAIVYAGGIGLEHVPEIMAGDAAAIIAASSIIPDPSDPQAMAAEAQKWLAALRGPARAGRKKSRPRETRGLAVCFGELMMRLSPVAGTRLVQAGGMQVFFGGAEANVAASLSRFGVPAALVTTLPENELGEAALCSLRREGVDTRFIGRKNARLGLYFLDPGAAQRPSRVIYDRAHSAFAMAGPEEYDWEAILTGAAWFHATGITPSLSPAAAEGTLAAVTMARRLKIPVSFDVNYRRNLWPAEQARKVLPGLLERADLILGNEEDFSAVFGIQAGDSDAAAGRLDMEGFRRMCEEVHRRFRPLRVALTLRLSISASVNLWSGCLYNGSEFLQSETYTIQVVDRVGSGDAFAAGLIHGLLQGRPDGEALAFAAAASCLKHSIAGDLNAVTTDEVAKLMHGGGTGRIER